MRKLRERERERKKEREREGGRESKLVQTWYSVYYWHKTWAWNRFLIRIMMIVMFVSLTHLLIFSFSLSISVLFLSSDDSLDLLYWFHHKIFASKTNDPRLLEKETWIERERKKKSLDWVWKGRNERKWIRFDGKTISATRKVEKVKWERERSLGCGMKKFYLTFQFGFSSLNKWWWWKVSLFFFLPSL